MHTTLSAKIHIHPRKHARVTVQQLLRHANNCNQYRNLSSAQETVRIHASLWRSRSCVVTQTSSDHPSWCGAHPVFLWFAFKAWPRSLSITNFYFHHCFCRVVGSTIVLAGSNIESLYRLYCPFLRRFEDGRVVTGIQSGQAVPEILQGILTFRLAGNKFGHPAQNEKMYFKE